MIDCSLALIKFILYLCLPHDRPHLVQVYIVLPVFLVPSLMILDGCHRLWCLSADRDSC